MNTPVWHRIERMRFRDGDACSLCDLPMDFTITARFVRGRLPLAVSVDHIVPLSKGGHRTDPANLRLAHKWCNHVRGSEDRLPRKHPGFASIVVAGLLKRKLLSPEAAAAVMAQLTYQIPLEVTA